MKTLDEKILATVTRTFPAPKGYQGTFRITAQLHQLGRQHPYFSVTGSIATDRQFQSGNWQAGGCLHEEALKAWPAIAPIIALHLSDSDGQPMHAASNGFYWIAGALGGLGERYHGDKPADECRRICQEHLRISDDEMATLEALTMEAFQAGCSSVATSPEVTQAATKAASREGNRCAKEAFGQFVETLRERWAQEAKDGLALIQSFANA